MEKLNDDWLTDNPIDFEYKKYRLIAYLKQVEKQFISNRLFPGLTDLINHYKILSQTQENKREISQSWPKKLESIDLKNFKLNYYSDIQDDRLLREVTKIADFSIPAIKKLTDEGNEIYHWVESVLHIQTIGIQPIYPHIGFLFLRNGEEQQTYVYEYRVSLLENAHPPYRSVSTTPLFSVSTEIPNSEIHIKNNLMKTYRLHNTPAVYCIESEVQLPVNETLLPVSRHLLAEKISQII